MYVMRDRTKQFSLSWVVKSFLNGWSRPNKKNKNYVSNLCTLQNKAIKLICDDKMSNRVTPYYSELDIIVASRWPKLFFGFHGQSISLHHSNIYFLRHAKYVPVTQAPEQTSTVFIYIPRYTTTRLQ